MPFGYVSEKTSLQVLFLGHLLVPLSHRIREEGVLSDHSEGFEPIVRREIQHSWPTKLLRAEPPLSCIGVPFSHIELVDAFGAIISLRCFSVNISHGLGDFRSIGAEHCIDLIFCDQFLVEADSRLLIGVVIVDHELDWSSEHPALRINMLLA